MPPERFDLFSAQLALARPGFEIIGSVTVNPGDDPRKALLPTKKMLALYIGGMGSREENFHKRMVERSGYAEAAQKIQDLWMSGKPLEAVGAVPDELADSLALVGSRENIRANLARWRKSPVTTLCMSVSDSFDDTVRNMEMLAAEIL
jgi:alkanesulfonate monooxygenase SsuD/methylene tetrahydromethanopterin reductase-like flavin-dependent oxidoreductase (luciferase family)